VNPTVYTAANAFLVGQVVNVADSSPAVYNVTGATISAATTTSFSIAQNITGPLIIGGTAYVETQWTSVCWSQGLYMFVAVGQGNSGNSVMTSPNGIIWTLVADSIDVLWTSVCWSPTLNQFAAVGYNFLNSALTPYACAMTLNAYVTNGLASATNSIAVGTGTLAIATNATAIGTSVIANQPNGLFMRHRVSDALVNPCGFIPSSSELIEILPYYCRVLDGTSNNFSSPDQIHTFNTIYSDVWSMFDGLGTITVPVAGYYHVHAQMYCSIGASPNGVYLSINGSTSTNSILSYDQSSSGLAYMFYLSRSGFFSAGTTFAIKTYQAGTLTHSAVTEWVSFEAMRIH
jgi:hypothetical protein